MSDFTACTDCGWTIEDGVTPLDNNGICWACLPCACGNGCGFASGLEGADGIKVCEHGMTTAELDAIPGHGDYSYRPNIGGGE